MDMEQQEQELQTLSQQVAAKLAALDIVYANVDVDIDNKQPKLKHCIIEQRIGVLKDVLTALDAVEKSINESDNHEPTRI